MEKFHADGIVIRVQTTGEADRILWVLTADRGVVRAFARGARSARSRLRSATSLFAYCRFTFVKTKDAYSVSEADIREVFFDLRNSLEALSLGQYFCEAASKTVPEDGTGEEYLRLLLNSLWFLGKNERSPGDLKAVFELRLASISGYMPALIGCEGCGTYETPTMYFDVTRGLLFCEACTDSTGIPLPLPVVTAMRHIAFSPFERLFAFSLAPELLPLLGECTERYLLAVTGQNFKTLEYYHTLFS